MSNVDDVRRLLEACTPEQRQAIFDQLRIEFPIHPLEEKWNVAAEVILEAIDRATDLTKRGIRGVIAEAAFGKEVIEKLPAPWKAEPIYGDYPYDFLIRDAIGPVRIQVKLQRLEAGKPKMYSRANVTKYRLTEGSYYVAETQRTRRGTDTATGEDTRPYQFGEFDILAVSMHPSTGDWSRFMLTVSDWLLPRTDMANRIAVYQPVSIAASDDWTDNLLECISWFRQGVKRRICQDDKEG
jgi:hypothetical protein